MEEVERVIGRIRAARADGYGIIVERRAGPGDGWIAAGDPGTDPAMTAAAMDSVSGMFGKIDPYIQAEWMLESLARAIGDLGGAFVLAAGALPPLEPDNLLLAIEGGLVRGTAITSDRLDPGDLPALAGRLREGLIRLLAPTVGWIDGRGLRPEKTMWLASADRLAQALVWCGRAFDRPDEALELTRLAVGPESPDPRLAIPLERAEDEYGEEFHLRKTCCLAYRTEGGELCQSCPLQRTRGS